MPEFISTDTVTLISLVCQKMAGLRKTILQYSTPNKKRSSIPFILLSPNQIKEAYLHPSNIIQQAFKAIATIQSLLNRSVDQLESLGDQRRNYELELAQLASFDGDETN